MVAMTTHTALRIAAAIGVAVSLLGCAGAPSAPVRRDVPAYALPVSSSTIEDQLRALPVARVATSSRADSPGLEETEAILRESLAGYGYSPTLEPIDWPSPENSAGWNNVIAEIRGVETPEEIILVAAHFDTVQGSPGADDNASGVAGVLEVARRLSSPAFAERSKRTVRFVLFNVEERGLYGSEEHAAMYAERRAQTGERIVGVINLEMIGYFSDEPGSQRSPIPRIPGVFEPPTVGDSIVLVANRDSSPFARDLDSLMRAGAPRLKTFLLDFVPGAGEAIPDVRRSDHAPFWDIGVPAVMVTDTSNFRNPHYHKSSDTIETLDLERMSMVVEGVEHAVRVMSGAMPRRTSTGGVQ